ncbi:hypothetical protein DPMN_065207 [Dreissena polymorpha]|uniref:Uncharacterized protein n=1 Tax=Dreissena polymorpha TaxID=45954 RepID=A0A9D4CES6_DREPO|nr:hypothetical protein DPMN_065207 [Dreissena polymorpha]
MAFGLPLYSCERYSNDQGRRVTKEPVDQWTLAVVVKVTPDKDGLVGRVRVKVGSRNSSSDNSRTQCT